MKSNRTPVMTDVLYSLQWFLTVLAVTSIFSDRINGDAFPLCVKMLPCAAAYVIIALTVRLTDLAVLRLLIPAAAAAGCVLLGSTMGERIVFGVVGLIAVGCGFAIHFNLKKRVTGYGGMFIISVPLALLALVAGAEGWTTALPWLNMISAIYLALCVAVWYLGRLTGAMNVFSRRADQPVELINKRMYSKIITVVLLVFIAALLVPQAGGGNLMSVVFKAVLTVVVYIVVFLAKLLPIFYTDAIELPEEQEESMLLLERNGEISIIGMYIIYFAAAALFIFIVVWLIRAAAKMIKQAVSDFLNAGERNRKMKISETDTVEKIERPQEKLSDRRTGRTNAGKVRRIYKKRIAAILGGSNGELNSLAPDEIAALCAQKGEDVTELTRLYKRARYTSTCTADDVRNARRL